LRGIKYIKLSRLKKSFLLATGIYIILLIFLWNRYGFAEDALITFVYSKNLAIGHGITYTGHSNPVEGSTEFLWMVMLSLGSLFNIDIGFLSRILSGIFGILIILFVSDFSNRYSDQRLVAYIAPIVASVTYLPMHTLTGFATVAFGFAYILSVWTCIHLLNKQDSIKYSISFLGSGLLIALIRPEGLLLFASILFTFLILSKNKSLFAKLSISFIVPLGIYHLFRYSYFGYLFPNPFYIKTAGALLKVSSMINIIHAYSQLNLILFVVSIIALITVLANYKKYGDEMLVLFSPVLMHFILYLFILQSQNVDHRFQYIYILFSIIILPLGIKGISIIFGNVKSAAGSNVEKNPCALILNNNLKYNLVVGILVVGMIMQPVSYLIMSGPGYGSSPINDEKLIAKNLSVYSTYNYTMLVSEAGALPYYSGWNAIDSGGLNDEYIAHNGYNSEYIDRYSPDLIMFHAGSSGDPVPPNCSTDGWNSGWGRMNEITYNYAVKNNYILATIIRRPGGTYNWYFVKKSNPHADEIVQIISNVDADHVKYNYNSIFCARDT